ncbi:DUF7518 family protein [Halohasta litorea]|uniref:BZIP transcription factor n=1 Tax=Halohasta litorea TaxID=869891 RepID=A0ABD6D6D1_9EURY|nr:bZIP transcription factor [Halohasta litorea]
MTNRVDDLESEIAELRAAVNGLTEELVETKARVRELETEAEEAEDDGFAEADPVESATSETTKSDDHVEVVEQEPSDELGASSLEGDNTPETEESTDESTDDGTEQSDIIVA